MGRFMGNGEEIIDLAFGNSVAVREAFLQTYDGYLFQFSNTALGDFNYPDEHGDSELISLTKNVIKEQTGQSCKHVFLTNGATGGANTALRVYKKRGLKFVLTRSAPRYMYYPDMILNSGLAHVEEQYFNTAPMRMHSQTVALLDYPSNPLHLMTQFKNTGIPTIVDGVYLNSIYTNIIGAVPRHDIMVGSYSKLTGINGLRVGWIATNDDRLALEIGHAVGTEYCGLSRSATDIIKELITNFNWDRFRLKARLSLDYNREMWSKLEKFFNGNAVGENGMFHYTELDRKAKELFFNANIAWKPGSDLGTDDCFARFNLGASNETIKKAVKAVLREDATNLK
jgi:aspartate/methionine/tyrosine aminotransferase